MKGACGFPAMGNLATTCDARGGKTLHDLYDVGEKLGSGNFGEVRKCRPHNSDDDLAVKIIDRSSAAVKKVEVHQRARVELDILTAVHHPNVIEVREVFEDDRFLYVVMECAQGGELFQAVADKHADVVETDLAPVGLQLLEALEYLHSNHIVHRDVKAQNVLLTQRPRPGRALLDANVKLIDFGLATKLPAECFASDQAKLDLVCGSPAMFAPEIWAVREDAPSRWPLLWGHGYGPKVDVWAVGVVLYMALLGTLPFPGRDPMRLASKVCDPKLQPAFEGRRGHRTSSNCRKFLASLLEKDQCQRPSAAAACQSRWLRGRSRGLLHAIPEEVRAGALEESLFALGLQLPEEGGFGDGELELAMAEAKAERGTDESDSELSESSSDEDDGSNWFWRC